MGLDTATEDDYLFEFVSKLINRIVHLTLLNNVILIGSRAYYQGIKVEWDCESGLRVIKPILHQLLALFNPFKEEHMITLLLQKVHDTLLMSILDLLIKPEDVVSCFLNGITIFIDITLHD